MTDQNFLNLTGKILIATPFAMEGNVFHKSLIYVIKHSDQGAIGLIFNRPVKNALANNLFNKFGENFDVKDLELDIHIGGPVEVERGFFLHSSEYDKNLLFKADQEAIAVSSNVQILKDIANGIGPKNSIFIVGYTGWESGQLDFELANNLWIVAEPDPVLMFAENSKDKWSTALNVLGISFNDFAPTPATC